MLLILLALDAGRVVPTFSLIEQLWEDEPPANSGNALQSLVSRLRTALRQAGLGDQAIESHPAGYRLAISPDEVDVVSFEAMARRGSQALASGDAVTAWQLLREALDAWRGPALADASAARFASGPAARLEELRARATLDLVEAGLAPGGVQGAHEQPTRAVGHRIGGDHGAQLADEAVALAQRQPRLDQVQGGAGAQFVQAGGWAGGEPRGRGVRERGSPPGVKGLPQCGAQPRDKGLQRVARVGGRFVLPQLFDQRVGGHHPARVEGQQDEQHAHPLPADPHRPASLVVYHEGSQ